MSAPPSERIEWLSNLVRLEIELWNQVDARLRAEHALPLAFFWPLYLIGRSSEGHLRVGELARAMGLTVGGASKVVDRMVGAGLLSRAPDATDRRASRVTLTDDGRRRLAAASESCEAALAALLDAALDPDEQKHMRELVKRLLEATLASEPN